MELTKDSLDKRIACVIVTYNRKQLLKRCLDAVASQTYKPTVVYITDNASTDGTLDTVKEWGYYECEKEGICFKYILNSKNEGGAGGFNLGMKTANEDAKYDALWVMDDDGEPERECLAHLVPYLDSYDYIAPIVLSDKDHSTCSFAANEETIEEFAKNMKAHDGVIDNWASPFNGILYSKRLVDKIGYPQKELFIWGDESNYHFRAKKVGVNPITILSAVHYHPVNRQDTVKSFRNYPIILPSADWKLYCYIRNLVFNDKIFRGKIQALRAIFAFIFLYGYFFVKNNELKRLIIVLEACKDGYCQNFQRHDHYIK